MNNQNFEKALAQTLKNEGVFNGKTGYVNSKNDSGGETNYGITKAKARECGYQGKMCDLPYETAKKIYYNEFWKKTNAANMPNFNLSFFLFDFAVNSGVANAAKKLQTAINKVSGSQLIVDGIIGKKTISTIEEYTKQERGYYHFFVNKIEKTYIAEILKYYTSLKNANTGFSKNGAGWINRVANNINFLMGV